LAVELAEKPFIAPDAEIVKKQYAGTEPGLIISILRYRSGD